MPAYAPQTLSLSLAGSTTPAAWTHWSGNPLTFSVSLTGSTDFTSCTLLRVELHSRRDSAEDGDSLLEYVEEANPASEPTALTFTGAQLNGLIADGSTSRRLWVCVVGYVDGSKYTFGSGWLTLLRDNYSGDSDTAHTPADNNFVTESQLNALAAVLYTAQTLTSDQQTQARTNISAAKSGAVTGSGLTMAGQRLLGRATGGVGALDEIQLGTGLALSGTSLSVLSSYGGQGAADGDMMVQFSADGSITATAGVHLTGDSGYVALYNDGALGVLFNPIDVNSHFGLLERKIALDQDTVWTLPNLSGTLMVGAANLGDLTDFGAARDTLGLGTADSPQFAGLQFSTDLFLRRAGAANLRHGGADSATPISQYDSVQNVSTGTSNTAGAARYFDGSQGTGTGAGGSIIFRTAAAGSSGSSQNALATTATFDSTGLFAIDGTTGNSGISCRYATQPRTEFGSSGAFFVAQAFIAWASSSVHHGSGRDTYLGRAAAGLIGLWGATNKTTGAGLHLPEMTAPAGYADAARIYAEDNGSGKTRLMVIFPSGAAQQIAIEP